MKKFILTMVTLLSAVTGAKAMGYEQAREQALFLTDKMAYELNLSQEQYEAAYEINLDYLMSVNTVDDVYSVYWTQRNLDMQAIFYDWQWSAFCAATYFYRPLYWDAGVWHFGIYAHYPVRTFFYYSRPVVWATYRGGHSWRHNGGRSWYVNHVSVYRVEHHRGMRHHVGTRPHSSTVHHNSTRSGNFGRNASPHRSGTTRQYNRESSTRSTVVGHVSGGYSTPQPSGSTTGSSSFGRNSGSGMSSRSSSFGGHSMGGSRSGMSSGMGSRSGGSFGGHSGGSFGGHGGGARGGRR